MIRDKTIRLMGLANENPHPLSGHYVISYDAEYHLPDGSYDGGALVTTPDRERATQFDLAAAILLYRSGPTCECHRVRSDGLPNKPLSAFTVEIA